LYHADRAAGVNEKEGHLRNPERRPFVARFSSFGNAPAVTWLPNRLPGFHFVHTVGCVYEVQIQDK
jgi:hypothetical protein